MDECLLKVASTSRMQTERHDGPSASPVSYPWDLDWEPGDSPVELFWTTDLQASPKALWPLLADTSSVNARLGLPEMIFQERGGQLHGSSGKLLTRQEWVEVPWEWEMEKSLTAERRYSKGFARAVRARYLLSDRWGGTRLTIYFGWIPRRWWSRSVLRWVNRWLQQRYTRVLAELDELATNTEARHRCYVSSNDVIIDEARLGKGLFALAEAGLSAIETERLAQGRAVIHLMGCDVPPLPRCSQRVTIVRGATRVGALRYLRHQFQRHHSGID